MSRTSDNPRAPWGPATPFEGDPLVDPSSLGAAGLIGVGGLSALIIARGYEWIPASAWSPLFAAVGFSALIVLMASGVRRDRKRLGALRDAGFQARSERGALSLDEARRACGRLGALLEAPPDGLWRCWSAARTASGFRVQVDGYRTRERASRRYTLIRICIRDVSRSFLIVPSRLEAAAVAAAALAGLQRIDGSGYRGHALYARDADTGAALVSDGVMSCIGRDYEYTWLLQEGELGGLVRGWPAVAGADRLTDYVLSIMRLGGGHAAPAFGTEAEGPALAPLAGRGGPAFRRRSPLLLLFPLFLVVMSGSRVVRLHSSIAIQRSAATFPSVDGILTEVRYRTDNKMQGIYPKYQYIVDGSEYAGTRYRYIRHRMEDDECVALAKSLSQRIGASVPVYYDPADPTVAMLDPGAINPGELWQLYLKGYFYLAFSGVFLLAGLVGVLVPRRVRADYTGMRTPAGLPQDSSGSPASKPAE